MLFVEQLDGDRQELFVEQLDIGRHKLIVLTNPMCRLFRMPPALRREFCFAGR